VTADGLTYDDILFMGQALKPMGGRPCEIGTVRGSPVFKYCVVGTTPGLFSLKQDPDYKQILRDAAPREKMDENPLFTGGYTDLDGHRIVEYNPIDPDGYAWSGSWFNAKAFTGAQIVRRHHGLRHLPAAARPKRRRSRTSNTSGSSRTSRSSSRRMTSTSRARASSTC
jgi:hypothetical protein